MKKAVCTWITWITSTSMAINGLRRFSMSLPLVRHQPNPCSTKTLRSLPCSVSIIMRSYVHEELRQTIEAWRPYLIGDDTSVDTLKMHSFHFDFSKVIATSIYIDLGRLLHAHALKDDNMSSLARYLFLHSNLSNSQATLYAQLRKYKKR